GPPCSTHCGWPRSLGNRWNASLFRLKWHRGPCVESIGTNYYGFEGTIRVAYPDVWQGASTVLQRNTEFPFRRIAGQIFEPTFFTRSRPRRRENGSARMASRTVFPS